MASIYDLKPKFQNCLRPLMQYLVKHQVTPNQVTLSALLLSFLYGSVVALHPTTLILLLFPAILLIRMMLNAIDGMIAREFNKQSHLGVFLNEIGDVLSDTFLYLPFSCIAGISPLLVIVIVILSICSEMTGVVAIQMGSTRRYDGPMGKSDRAFTFSILAILLAIGISATIINFILLLTIGLLVATIARRLKNAIKEVSLNA